LLAKKAKLPAIIFDEIDTGVSARIADAMGEIIRTLAENMQVVAITHLPQVASKGESHFVVYKQQSRTNITRLGADERVEEIAKMLSGSVITEAALSQARLLLGRGDSLF
jgi:DNA repair protein RecN (Recombination protein N)